MHLIDDLQSYGNPVDSGVPYKKPLSCAYFLLSAEDIIEHFSFTSGSDSRVCLLSGTRMAHEGALYLIGHVRSRPTLIRARFP